VEETAAIALASITTELIVAALYLLIRLPAQSVAPSIDLLVQEPGDYVGWVVGLLATASGLSAVAAWWVRRRRVHPAVMSSWWTLFHYWHKGATRHIQCELDDGSCVTGVLGDWNIMEEDSPDRDLILAGPITYRPAGDEEFHPHPVSVVCISASRIVAMFVAYSDASTSSASVEGAAAAAPPSQAQALVAGSVHVPGPARAPSAALAFAHAHDRPRRSPSRISRAP
jgi:hypothetical protein